MVITTCFSLKTLQASTNFKTLSQLATGSSRCKKLLLTCTMILPASALAFTANSPQSLLTVVFSFSMTQLKPDSLWAKPPLYSTHQQMPFYARYDPCGCGHCLPVSSALLSACPQTASCCFLHVSPILPSRNQHDRQNRHCPYGCPRSLRHSH